MIREKPETLLLLFSLALMAAIAVGPAIAKAFGKIDSYGREKRWRE